MRWFTMGVSFDVPVFQKTGNKAPVVSKGSNARGTTAAEGGPPPSYVLGRVLLVGT
jgi:hypothetical protein